MKARFVYASVLREYIEGRATMNLILNIFRCLGHNKNVKYKKYFYIGTPAVTKETHKLS